ncbi:hypothetical protein [Streptococcus cristatus]|nr:hypothetical protein [Streptococcus cristatus]
MNYEWEKMKRSAIAKKNNRRRFQDENNDRRRISSIPNIHVSLYYD